METDRAVKLLEEIRDAQKEHLELYKQAFVNQKESVQNQQEAITYQRTMFKRVTLVILPVIAFIVGLIIWIMASIF